jgi:glycosyltransferase involved in cell wall biosynthesis
VHESGWLAGVGVWLGGRLGIPVVCKVRNTPALDIIGYDVPFRRTWEKLRRKAHYIALHNGLRHELLREGISDDAISVIPNGVVIPPPSKQERNRNEVLYVGNFSQGSSHKGFDVLIRAWGMVHEKKPLARLTMVGGGKYDHWLALAEIYQCAGSICFCGAVAEPELYYSRASLFVLPSRHEGMSNALLEAQSFGLPVVVSDIPANRAVVEHEVTGLIVPSGDADALAQAICGLLCDVELCTLLGANARERIKKRFSSDQVVERLLALYRKLVVDNLP